MNIKVILLLNRILYWIPFWLLIFVYEKKRSMFPCFVIDSDILEKRVWHKNCVPSAALKGIRPSHSKILWQHGNTSCFLNFLHKCKKILMAGRGLLAIETGNTNSLSLTLEKEMTLYL